MGAGRGGVNHRDRVVTTVTMRTTRASLFLDVRHFAARRHLAVLANDAPAGQGGEADQPNKTHHVQIPRAGLCVQSSNIRA